MSTSEPIYTAPEYVHRDIQGRQGIVKTGPTPVDGYQVQFWAPVSPNVTFNDPSKIGYTGIANGRIVHLNTDGYVEPGLPNNIKFTMPLLVQSGGNGFDSVPSFPTSGQQTPYMSAFPGPNPNINLLPVCSGYEFLSTEYAYLEAGYDYVPGHTALTAIYDLDDPSIAGLIVPLTAANEICLGIVSRPPGVPRPDFDPNSYYQGIPNNSTSVTGKNEPGLSFWGCPFPAGVLVTPEPEPPVSG